MKELLQILFISVTVTIIILIAVNKSDEQYENCQKFIHDKEKYWSCIR